MLAFLECRLRTRRGGAGGRPRRDLAGKTAGCPGQRMHV